MVAVRESAEASAVGKVIVTPSTLPVRSAIWLSACRVPVGAEERAEFLGVEFGLLEGAKCPPRAGSVTGRR